MTEMIFVTFAFKKFKVQVRRERHQATTNQKAVFPITGSCFWRTAILSRRRERIVLRQKESENKCFLLTKCREEYTQRFKRRQS